MDIIENLKQERKRLEQERAKACAEYDRAIAEIDAATDAIMKSRASKPAKKSAPPSPRRAVWFSIDDAILEAVANGVQTPAKILDYLSSRLGIDTTINSVRTRVSRLRADGRLARDDGGWVLPKKNPVDDGVEAKIL